MVEAVRYSLTMALVQPKMSTRNIRGGGGVKGDRRIRFKTSPLSVSRLSRKYGSLEFSRLYRLYLFLAAIET
jgi:hypothetical protein